jgi:hypothetical protein
VNELQIGKPGLFHFFFIRPFLSGFSLLLQNPRIYSSKNAATMKNKKIILPFVVITIIIAALAMSRLLPHPFNFSPVAALALFGGARFSNRFAAYLIPLAAVWISDLFLNFTFFGRFVPFYEGALFTYIAFALIVLLGSAALRKLSAKGLLLTSLSASVIFFVISNFGVWVSGTLYPLNATGLVACYSAAIPFFRNTIVGDLIYSFAIFYGYAYAQSRISILKTA